MPRFLLEVTEVATGEYEIEAATPEEARKRLDASEWDFFRDLGHSERVVHEIKQIED